MKKTRRGFQGNLSLTGIKGYQMSTMKKRLPMFLLALAMMVAMALPTFAASPPYSARVWIYNCENSMPNLNAACESQPTDHTNVTMWSNTNSDTQRWDLRAIDTTKNLCYIRNYANTQYALNIYRVNNNCDLFPFANNSADDCTIKCVDEGSSRFGIVLPAYALCLTPTGFTNGSNVNWQSSTGETKQLWRIFTNR